MPMKKGVKEKPVTSEDIPQLDPALLLRMVDEYIYASCEAGVRANDCGTVGRIEKLEKALQFARTVYDYLGVKNT